MSVEEKSIIKKILDGDNDAFAELYFRYEKYIFAVAKRIVKLDQDAEEVTQDVFYRVLKGLSGFKGESKLSSWLYRITQNLSLNRIRDQRREREDTVGLPEDLVSSAPAPEKEYEKKEAAEAVNSLPDRYRKALELYYSDGLSYKEIAEEMGVPINTVKTLISRGKNEAEKILKGR
jgi:RNA polymerase sigma-70 factor (ECF subfamily)